MLELSPRSSSSTVGISSRIIGQEDETLELNPSNVVNNSSRIDVTSGEHLPNHLHHQSNGDLRNSHGKNKTIKMILLTQSIAAVQFTWSVELAYGTPYLLELGLSKSLMSLVWLAGPLAGLLVQPIVGALSDNSTSKYGRRRPYIVIGSIAVVIAFVSIGWTKSIVGLFFSKDMVDITAIWLAVFSLYVLDFAINAVMAGCRALIVDSLPPSQQEEGTAWAGKMVGIGSVIGYFMGYINLVYFFPFLGGTQLQVLCVLASIILLASDALTCWAIPEKINKSSSSSSISIWATIQEVTYSITKSFNSLPKKIQLLCNVQLFAWMGWFPFLFYTSSWVAEIYIHTAQAQQQLPFNDPINPNLKQESERTGSFSLLLFSIVSMAASFILPFLVTSSVSMPLKFAWNQFSRLPLVFLTLPKLWTLSHFIFAFSMLTTWTVSNIFQADLVIGLCGISWAVAMWAPFSIIGEFASKQTKVGGSNDNSAIISSTTVSRNASRLDLIGSVHRSDDDDGAEYEELENMREVSVVDDDNMEDMQFLDHNQFDDESIRRGRSTRNDLSNNGFDAGILLGIHNIYIVIPQFIATFFSSVAFALLEHHDHGTPGNGSNETTIDAMNASTQKEINAGVDSIGFVLRCGGFMAIIAGFLSMKLWK
ncbi:MFS general substrate transporter [Gigaspora margarita]|uniref:MFS general substrate transporter n=1 Tax=Gigaspora margarita TaxID=4874 RepID=A0A8H4B3D9_GIGMA|nr:MFS general substrate transporter [Gigaspora margarita]